MTPLTDADIVQNPKGAASPESTHQSPAFQFYPESWFSSSKIQRMNHTERGIYIDLLGFCWLENGLPLDVATLAQMVKMPVARFARLWNGPLHECFFERNGRLFNARQERERKKQLDFRQHQQAAAHMRWRRDAHAPHMPDTKSGIPDAMLSVSISDPISKEEVRTCAEPHSDSTPAPSLMDFPTIGAVKTWSLTQNRLDDWVKAYKNIGVLAECWKALAWIEANPHRRKTVRGMPRYLIGWLNRAVNHGSGSMPTGRGPAWLQNVRAKEEQGAS